MKYQFEDVSFYIVSFNNRGGDLMAVIIILLDIIYIVRFKWSSFKYHDNKIEFYMSIFFTIICSGIHQITEVFEGSLYSINMGFPFPWMEKHISYEQLMKPMNYFEFTEISYQIIVFALNSLIIYCLMIGTKKLFIEKELKSNQVL